MTESVPGTVPGTEPAAAGSAGPTGDHERAEILDVLRGFALLGIFLAHVPGFSGWDYLEPAERLALDPGTDGALQFLRDLLVRGKFYSLFSLLFGIGFALQARGALAPGAEGAAFAKRFRRRQLGLLAIGVAHSALWHGDILLTYALLGLALLPVARRVHGEPRRLLHLALGAFALRGLWGVLTFSLAGMLAGVGDAAIGDGAGGVDVGGSLLTITAGYSSPEWSEMLSANARFLRLKWLLVLYDGRLWSISGFFLLGAALGLSGFHHRIPESAGVLRRATLVLGGFGLAGNAALAVLWPRVETYPPSILGVATNLVYAASVPALALAMTAGIALLWTSGVARPLLAPFAAPGRTALTTYLSQTAIGIGVFYGVGFGLRGTLSLAEGLAFVLVVFALQTVAAHAWLRAFRFGPIEWAWRCITYGRLLPLRRGSQVTR